MKLTQNKEGKPNEQGTALLQLRDSRGVGLGKLSAATGLKMSVLIRLEQGTMETDEEGWSFLRAEVERLGTWR